VAERPDPQPDEYPEVEFRSDVTVELVRAHARDADVLFAARVSTKGEQSREDVEADPSRSKGLLNFLMRDRHGCYDAETEVLTRSGWVPWPEVTGREFFATLSPEGRLEYQRAQRLISKPYDGPMVRVRKTQVDLLVTPDHRMYVERRRQPHQRRWELSPASDLGDASHRMQMGGARWEPETPLDFSPAWFSLLGFFVGDGHTSERGTPTFRLRKEREISFLTRVAEGAGYTVTRNDDRFYLNADEEFRLFAKRCYDIDGAKTIPWEVREATPECLQALLDGLWHSDGSVSTTGKRTYVTTSRVLAGQIQEVALKVGEAAVITGCRREFDAAHFGTKPLYLVTWYRARNRTPKIGWTQEDRRREVTVEHYRGRVYCVTVPNGTLYVRRNGRPVWSGNSPFEHNSLTFYVQAPIFVFREFMRHRVASYNEESGRYRELRPVFYVPGPERRLVQVGKPGAYVFEPGTAEQHKITEEATRRACLEAYRAYREMLDAGVAREVARVVLPVTTYSSMYVTMNARALMNFLSLRTKREGAAYPSYPQREIEMVAERMEEEWAALMPLTHEAFEAHGRVAP
jgi:thymidylate synthase (FAD)